MRRFYRLLAEALDRLAEPITPRDVYSFYYLTTQTELGRMGQFLVNDFLTTLRQKYLSCLHGVVVDQLEKYYQRRRLDPGSYTPEQLSGASHADLDRYMRATYRSDMRRRNTVWESLTGNLAGLERARDPKQISYFIDRINNDVHNTGDLVLEKLANGYELIAALDRCHSADPRELRALAHPDLRKLDEAARR